MVDRNKAFHSPRGAGFKGRLPMGRRETADGIRCSYALFRGDCEIVRRPEFLV